MGEWLLLGVCGTVAVTGGAADDGNSSVSCPDGLLLPAWQPLDNLTTVDRVTRGTVYLMALLYLFLGVSVVSDRFMSAIEIITSQETEVVLTIKNGILEKKCERVWNETVANLTLMALGSSAPEILLSVIEIYAKHFESGELGPGTIVGSAAYNLFTITALCVSVIPEGENRKIKKIGVFIVTAFMSVFAYTWLYVILAVISISVVEVWEAILTFFFFPGLVLAAYIVDKCSPDVMDSDQNGIEILGDTLEKARADYTILLRDLKTHFPKKDLNELARIAEERIILSGPKSRAYYRILVTRGITGNVIRKQYFTSTSKRPSKKTQANRMSGTFFRFEHGTYTVLENIGSVRVAVVREGADIQEYVILEYCTEDGTAKAGLDYVSASGTLVFKPSELSKTIDIRIIDDNIFESDEYFFIHLTGLHLQNKSSRYVKLKNPKTTKILILDDDHAGEFSFEKEVIVVREEEGVYELPVVRMGGVRGTVRVPYWTIDGTAEAGVDYIAARGFLVFVNNETRRTIPIGIVPEHCYERNVSLFVELGEPEEDNQVPNNIHHKREEEMTSEEKIALEGRPRLGAIARVQINIRESDEFKNTVDKLVEKRGTSAMSVSTSSWGEQFAEAIRVNPEPPEGEEDGLPETTGCGGYFLHFLTLFWKILFAFVPPADMCSGYLCFVFSIFWIGVLTAVIGDLASHFGCTVGLQDAVTAITFVALGTSVPGWCNGWLCFWTSITFIGLLTAIIGDVSSHLGCSVGIKDAVTATCLVAMGTSLPDTFASKVAAIQDATADNSVGNVTGSNAVNVFLGIGVAWSIAAIYHAYHGSAFIVPPGNLGFSVMLFCTEALFAIAVLLLRRTKYVGGELGGPVVIKYVTSAFMFGLWLIYLTLSTLEAYGVFKV